MGFVYEDEELELNYKDTVYKFRAPSTFEQKSLMNKFKAGQEGIEIFDLYIDFFKSLGLPEEVLQKMSTKGLSNLFAYAVGADYGSKKN